MMTGSAGHATIITRRSSLCSRFRWDRQPVFASRSMIRWEPSSQRAMMTVVLQPFPLQRSIFRPATNPLRSANPLQISYFSKPPQFAELPYRRRLTGDSQRLDSVPSAKDCPFCVVAKDCHSNRCLPEFYRQSMGGIFTNESKTKARGAWRFGAAVVQSCRQRRLQ